MKNKITILSLALALASCKTTSGPVDQASMKKHREFPETRFAEFAQPTPQKDTLYLIKDEEISKIIDRIWKLDTIKVKPEIVMVTKDDMICIKARCNKNK